ncbi:hypothetical protein MKL09_29930 [Methylobacterium sp. J-048]|uniref:hypothetical protein n=1 Tax=Methylobacterium sp. J-048 TaxID=2836635 RepID=UPI001FB9AA1D|nr:hypothetical protein [Methylobacterium sp. J-048]MCJ2060727.1 hypothetical protein [Methylobacterium sp. J-048]
MKAAAPIGAAAFSRFGTVMRRVSMPMLLLVLASTAARAEDFTGFYAGPNAGYAWGRDRGRREGAHAPDPIRTDANPDLPPSARDAALALRRSDRRGPGTADKR